ncbi:unnamed protein product [Strongylus vulgaris]|uniref:SH2 domain-containing protein n=1 Tax=Strongylus vulgaris TaxID=40348 RepID=A0A3P7LGF1_STRVU|nr:unnamed protein product [Strongylus vulgaris]
MEALEEDARKKEEEKDGQKSRRKKEEFVRKRVDKEEIPGEESSSMRKIKEEEQVKEDRRRRREQKKKRKELSSKQEEDGSDYDETSQKVRKAPEEQSGSPDSSRKQAISDFSSSVSRGLVGELDVSESAKSRKRRERREKKKKERREHYEAPADEQQMFESIRNIMPREEKPFQQNRTDMSKSRPPISTAAASQQPLKGIAKSVYIGVCNFAKAEEQVEKRSDFRVYHQLAHRPLLDDLEQELPLIVVYKTANGSFRHYPIRRRKVGASSYFYVDYGDPKVQAHASLDHLVRYYQINAQRHPNNRQYADQFPWWEVHL